MGSPQQYLQALGAGIQRLGDNASDLTGLNIPGLANVETRSNARRLMQEYSTYVTATPTNTQTFAQWTQANAARVIPDELKRNEAVTAATRYMEQDQSISTAQRSFYADAASAGNGIGGFFSDNMMPIVAGIGTLLLGMMAFDMGPIMALLLAALAFLVTGAATGTGLGGQLFNSITGRNSPAAGGAGQGQGVGTGAPAVAAVSAQQITEINTKKAQMATGMAVGANPSFDVVNLNAQGTDVAVIMVDTNPANGDARTRVLRGQFNQQGNLVVNQTQNNAGQFVSMTPTVTNVTRALGTPVMGGQPATPGVGVNRTSLSAESLSAATAASDQIVFRAGAAPANAPHSPTVQAGLPQMQPGQGTRAPVTGIQTTGM